MEGIPIEPAGPPAAEVFAERAAELTPEDASDEVRARSAQVAEHAHRHAERQWNRQQTEAGVAAFDWVEKNPGRSVLAIPPEVRDWLAPDQWRGLEALLIDGRPRTDRDLFERLDWQMIYEPDAFAGADLDRYKLSLDVEDHARFVAAQKAIAEGRVDPGLARYDRMRHGIDRAVKALGIDTDGPVAATVRAEARDRLKSFEIIEGRPPNGRDIDAIDDDEMERHRPEEAPDLVPSPADPVEPEAPSAPGASGAFGGSEMARPPHEKPGKGHNNPPEPVDDGRPPSRPPSGPPVPPFPPGQRPSWRQSELDDVRDLAPDFEPQVAFKNGREVSSTTRDSVRPDGVSKDRRSASFETKNYDINANSDGLVGRVVEQVLNRVRHLPPGMQQNIRIDARGQQVSEEQLNDVARRIVERSNGLLKPENIEFRRVR